METNVTDEMLFYQHKTLPCLIRFGCVCARTWTHNAHAITFSDYLHCTHFAQCTGTMSCNTYTHMCISFTRAPLRDTVAARSRVR